MIINTSEVTINGHVYLQMDKTFAQIVEAYKAGQNILVFFGNETTTYCYYPIEGIYCDTTFETDSQNIIVRGYYFKLLSQNLNSYPVCYNTDYTNW